MRINRRNLLKKGAAGTALLAMPNVIPSALHAATWIKKNDTIKFGLSAKFIILLVVLVGFLFALKYLPKLLTFFPSLQGLISPLLGILRSFLPF